MMTEYEAQKLRESMYKELNVGPLAVWQCAAGLLIVIGLAVLGASFNPRPDGPSDVARAQERPQASVSHTAPDGQDQAYAATPSLAEDRPALISVTGGTVAEAR